jgi:rRNA maturation endonuclease Nob1
MSNSLEPDEIKRVKLHRVKCSQCKANLMIRPTEKVCPVCGGSFSKPMKRGQEATSCASLSSSKSVN